MKTKKLYRVVAVIGRKRNTIYETEPFDISDGNADYWAWKQARKAREEYTCGLWSAGYSVTTDGSYIHIGKGINAGRIEVCMYNA